ncbi:hypothetical protein MASR2M16_31850 [Thauera terpenica]
MQIFLDIETAPTEDVDTIATIRASIRPPANYKKPETLAAWREAEGEAAALDAIARTALDGGAGQVIAVGLALDDEQPPLVLCRGTSETEADLLRRFFETVARWTAGGAVTDAHGRSIWPDAPYFIAHNAAFDLGFLWRRCIVLGLRPPFPLPGPNARAGKDYGCTMQAWAGYRERVSLQALCRALSLPDPKAEGTGAQAWQWWKAGDVERVATYCAGDVRAVRDIWHRVSAMAGGLTA